MALVTLKGHIQRAIDFFLKDNIHFVLGKTTPWEDDNNPPVPTLTEEIQDVLGYRLITSRYMVKPDPEGELTYRDSKWKIISSDNAMEEGARWVYLSVFLESEELPLTTYRQVGVTTGLERAENVPIGKPNLLPEEVVDSGILEVIDNRKPVYRQLDQKEKLVIILEF